MPTHKVGSMNKPAAHFTSFCWHAHGDRRHFIVTFSEADVADMVASYEPSLCDARSSSATKSWTTRPMGQLLRSVLMADMYATRVKWAAICRAGEYRPLPQNQRLDLFAQYPGNPKPGHHYLRHVGFLGAAAPSLKGLQRPAEFCRQRWRVGVCVAVATPLDQRRLLSQAVVPRLA